MLHQLGRALDRHLIEALDETLGRAHLLGDIRHDLDGRHAAANAARMRRADDGVASLHGREHLVDDGRCRVRHGDQCGDHAHRLANGGDLGDIVLPEEAECCDIAQILGDRERVEHVLEALVAGIAVAGLLDRHLAEAQRLRHDGARHRLHDLVDALRRRAEKPAIGLERRVGALAGLGDRLEISVHQRNPLAMASMS